MCHMVMDPDVSFHFNYFGTIENDKAEEQVCMGEFAHITF